MCSSPSSSRITVPDAGLLPSVFRPMRRSYSAMTSGGKPVRIGAERILDDEPHHFPVARGRVLPRADLGHPPVRGGRDLGRGRRRERVQQAEARERREAAGAGVEDVAESVGALVAEVGGVGKLADAEGVADDDDCAGFGHELLLATTPSER